MKFAKSLAAAATALVAVLAVPVAAAPAASAAGACNMYPQTRVAIWHPYTQVPMKAYGACTSPGGFGAWEMYHPTQGWQDVAIFDGTSSTSIDRYSDETLGRMTWRPGMAWDSSDNELVQNSPVTEFRVGSWAAVSATRSGSTATLTTRAVRYATSLDRNITWAGATGTLQYRVPGTSTWKGLKYVSTNASGVYSYRYATSQVRDYRVVMNGTPTIWDYTSATVRK